MYRSIHPPISPSVHASGYTYMPQYACCSILIDMFLKPSYNEVLCGCGDMACGNIEIIVIHFISAVNAFPASIK